VANKDIFGQNVLFYLARKTRTSQTGWGEFGERAEDSIKIK